MLKNVRYEDYEITYKTGNRFAFMGNGYSQTEMDDNGDPVVRVPNRLLHGAITDSLCF